MFTGTSWYKYLEPDSRTYIVPVQVQLYLVPAPGTRSLIFFALEFREIEGMGAKKSWQFDGDIDIIFLILFSLSFILFFCATFEKRMKLVLIQYEKEKENT